MLLHDIKYGIWYTTSVTRIFRPTFVSDTLISGRYIRQIIV